ncbi:sodium/proton antiporter NhaB [Emcibacter sp. SYSU 3D8]|uniref:sodium/proton antiporter NhaB n=1 Tax=Emcibacter sp. SYSU 3D8 TaxID=3133969 RepID=UPI0031FE78A5
MSKVLNNPFLQNFIGNTPVWYKAAIVGFLVANPILLALFGPVFTGWVLVAEFIFTLAMALKCYPLQPGGLLAIEAVFLGMTSPEAVYHEVQGALPVILLLMFMVAGIYFMKDLLLFIFTKLLLRVRNKMAVSLLFSLAGAVLSAFLDALTVTAVVIAIGTGFYAIYHRVASGKGIDQIHDHTHDRDVHELHRSDLDQFRAFLRGLLMHAAVGTALGGVCTLVGEPQNILIAERTSWDFVEFFFRMVPVTMPVLAVGLLTCALLEKTKLFGYGATLPTIVRDNLLEFDRRESEKRTDRDRMALVVQALAGVWLTVALMFHLAEVGLIGLSVIVLTTAFMGVIDEHRIGHAFEEALPFTALLVVFFAVVAVIDEQQLFTPVIHAVLQLDGAAQVASFYLANGVLSAISDNVFVATIYINQVAEAWRLGEIPRDQFDLLAVAINTGTNIPSVATPNGQAAFLFLLTSALAPLIRLSYMRMVVMALPYTITMTLTGLAMVYYVLVPATDILYDLGLINHHVPTIEAPAAPH